MQRTLELGRGAQGHLEYYVDTITVSSQSINNNNSLCTSVDEVTREDDGSCRCTRATLAREGSFAAAIARVAQLLGVKSQWP